MGRTPGLACASYEAQCAGSNEIVAAASLDDVGRHPDHRSGNANLRWMLIHLVEETRRHAGHANLVATARKLLRASLVRPISLPACVDRPVEASGPTAPAAFVPSVGSLVLRFGDRVLDLASPQVAAVATGWVSLVSAEVARRVRGGSCRSGRPVSVPGPHRGGAAGACVFPRKPRGFLRAPAACWWARQEVESTLIMDQSMRPSASASARTAAKSVSHVPSAGQRRCRSYTVFHRPKRAGRSRHGTPVRCRSRIPLITLR